jgi:uncharacterized protein (TIGR03435 family)
VRRNSTLAVCLCAATIAWGQESFEAASIKPHPGVITRSSDPAVTGNRVTAMASRLMDMIYTAYRVRPDQVVGLPGWAASEHYDLEATAGHAITVEQMRAMLRTLLAQRFQLQVHRETREIPMYSLALGKNGPKFKESEVDETPKSSIMGDGVGMHMVVAKGTMAQLASRLSSNGAGRPVMDKTGLTGIYSFKLDWVNDTATAGELPSLAVALQEQLGLKLEAAKGPVEFIVVDHVERPSAN